MTLKLSDYGIAAVIRPFICVSPLNFTPPCSRYSWMFFSSKNAVAAFFNKMATDEAVKYAAIGHETAEALRSHTGRVDFCGEEANTDEVAIQFRNILSDADRVLFPQGRQGRRVVQSLLPAHQFDEIVVYETVLSPWKIKSPVAAVFFTSPGNVDGFLLENRFCPATHYLAIGATTAAKLRQHGVEPVVPRDFSTDAVIEALVQLFS